MSSYTANLKSSKRSVSTAVCSHAKTRANATTEGHKMENV